MSLKGILENKVNLVIVSSKDYNKQVCKVMRKFKKKNICYVTVNKGVESVIELLKKGKVSKEHIYFIDCITKTIVKPEDRKDTFFCSSPNALTEISLAMNKIIDSEVAEIIVVDSLSSLLVYHKPNTLMKFVYHIVNKVRNSTVLLILVSPREDRGTDFFEKLKPSVDNIIEI